MDAIADEHEAPKKGSYEWAMYHADEWYVDPGDDDDDESYGNDVAYRRVAVRRRGWANPHTLIHYSLQVPLEALCREDREALDWYPIYEA